MRRAPRWTVGWRRTSCGTPSGSVATDGDAAPRKLDIEVPGDLVDAAVERVTVRADAERVVPSPDGSQVALVVKGDVYVVQRRAKDLASVADAPTVRVTETVGRERDVVWSPDGKRLVYASDRSGRYDLFAASAVGRDDGRLYRADVFVETPLTATADLDERSPQPSPDGERLAWVRGKGSLVVARADGSEPRTLFEHWGDVAFAWSPDSKWIAFAREDQSHNTEVFVIPAAGGDGGQRLAAPAERHRPGVVPGRPAPVLAVQAARRNRRRVERLPDSRRPRAVAGGVAAALRRREGGAGQAPRPATGPHRRARRRTPRSPDRAA